MVAGSFVKLIQRFRHIFHFHLRKPHQMYQHRCQTQQSRNDLFLSRMRALPQSLFLRYFKTQLSPQEHHKATCLKPICHLSFAEGGGSNTSVILQMA